ncbi:hypothetical protein H2203_007553 [Taxawa tesnikishii (nom. ined.)]|nr:hypothetical protein H2203_007553 [Dothideales sp. JES 119]
MEQDAPAVLVDAARLPVPSSRGPSPAPSCATTTAATTTAATTTAAAATTTTATNASGGEAKKKEKWCKYHKMMGGHSTAECRDKPNNNPVIEWVGGRQFRMLEGPAGGVQKRRGRRGGKNRK